MYVHRSKNKLIRIGETRLSHLFSRLVGLNFEAAIVWGGAVEAGSTYLERSITALGVLVINKTIKRKLDKESYYHIRCIAS